MNENIKLVHYTDEDYEFVYEVKKNAYKKYVEECWGSWDEEAQRGFFDKFINSVKNNAYIIMAGDNKIGFYNGEVLSNGNYEVGNICIIPEYQGKGIGTKILKEKLEENKDRDIEIQYFKQNPVGKLYDKLGFIPNGETEFHYQMLKSKRIKGYKFRKISPEEFDKLYDLFPDEDELWYKYREKRLKEFANHETDTYVIEYENKFIGEITVNYICHDLPTEAIPNQRVYLQAYRLEKKYQKQGIGQELVSYVLNDLELKGYTEFTIGVEEDNEIAKHIYFKFGFTEEIDHGKGDVFDSTDYTLYMRSVQKENKLKK